MNKVEATIKESIGGLKPIPLFDRKGKDKLKKKNPFLKKY